MRADDDDLVDSIGPANLDDQIGDFDAVGQIRLSIDAIAALCELALNQRGGGRQRGGTSNVPWTDQASQPINMPFQPLGKVIGPVGKANRLMIPHRL
jgi:hypothetical protein